MKNNKDNPGIGLSFLYNNKLGRIILKIFVCNRWFTVLVSFIMKSRISSLFIKRFIKKNNINMDDYDNIKYKSFNDFFIRYIKRGKRNYKSSKDEVLAPCDSNLLHYKITNDLVFNVKSSKYSLGSILNDEALASRYKNGDLLIFRLAPKDYHHYYFIDDGNLKKTYTINGKFHTVNPIVYDKFEVFKENTRCINILKTKNMDDVLYIEVGALLVGKIKNIPGIVGFNKMDEKGYFEYGGSTIIVVFKQDIINIDKKIVNNSKNNIETAVKLGEKIGKINK